MTLNLLSISFDSNLASTAKSKHFSGALQRQLDFAQKMDDYAILTPRASATSPKKVQLSANLNVYTTPTAFAKRYIPDAYQAGSAIINAHGINCLTAANPQKTGLVGYLLKRRFNLPLNINIMADIVDNPYYIKEHRRNVLYNLFTKWLIKRADTIRISTQWEYDKLSTYSRLPELWLVPFYSDPAPFLNATAGGWRKQLLGNTFDHILLSMGRLSTQKDPLTLLKATAIVLKKHPRTCLVFAGKGPMHARLEAESQRLGIDKNVKIIGAIPYEEAPSLFQAADIFAISSIYEGTCMVLQEAAVSQKPIVSTQFAGALDMINHGENGFLTPIGDPNALATHICQLIETPQLRKEMGKKAKATALALYPKDQIINQYIKMWQATVYKKTAFHKKTALRL